MIYVSVIVELSVKHDFTAIGFAVTLDPVEGIGAFAP